MDEHERELRRLRLGAREAHIEVEVAEAELAFAQRLLTDVLADWAAEGRRVRLDAVDRQRQGTVVHVGSSVVIIENDGGDRELVVLEHVEGLAGLAIGGRRTNAWTAGHPQSLLAHLRQLVGEMAMVVVERRTTAPMKGNLVGVAEDHLVIREASGADVVVPIGVVVSVISV